MSHRKTNEGMTIIVVKTKIMSDTIKRKMCLNLKMKTVLCKKI